MADRPDQTQLSHPFSSRLIEVLVAASHPKERMPLIARHVIGVVVSLFALVCAVAVEAQSLAGGAGHSLFLTSTGTVWTVGSNGDGQLGDNTTTTRKVPILVSGLTNVSAVAAGFNHSLALKSDGTLWAWGDNAYGQLGDGSTTDRKVPVQITALSSVVTVAAGQYHSVAVTASGQVYTWGRNANGQLGTGNMTNSSTPVQILSSAGASVGAGTTHTLVVKSDGTAWGTGSNGYGQLGNGNTTQQLSLVQMTGVAGAVRADGGERFSVVLLADGTAVAAGYNNYGQLGDDSNTQRTTAVAVVGLTGATAIAVNEKHTVALTSSGQAFAWGFNGYGQLGDGTTTERDTATLISALPAVQSVGTGNNHSLALTGDGTLWVWGHNGSYQLGDGTITDRVLPDVISGSAFSWRVATPSLSVSSGTYTSDRNVVVTTETAGATIRYTRTGIEPTESDPIVASGGTVTVSETQTLMAKAWKIGMPSSATVSATYTMKVPIPTFSPSAGTFTSPTNVTLSSSQSGVTFHYTVDGSVPTESSPTYTGPILIGTTTSLKAIARKANWTTSDPRNGTYTMNFGTLAPPTIHTPAGTYEGQVSVTLSTPQSGAKIRYTTNGNTPTAASTEYAGPVSITTTATLKAKVFHDNYATSSEASAAYTIKVPAPTLSLAPGTYAPGAQVTIVSPDATATLHVTFTGADPASTDGVVASGTTLFVGGFTLKVRATRAGCVDSDVTTGAYVLTEPLSGGALAAGAEHTVLATPQGLLYAWGRNTYGQVGDSSTTTRTAPTPVPSLTGVISLATGDSHTLALTWDGRVFGWGYNNNGRLGDGTMTNRTAPVLVPSLSDVVAIAAGGSHSLALTANGEVYAWGVGTSGQLGQGVAVSLSVPALVPGLTGIVAIAAGESHSLALSNTGQLRAWGLNTSGQLGDGTTTTRTSPVLVAGLTQVSAIRAGGTHTLARLHSAAVYAWGAGSQGQLGLGGTANVTTPAILTGFVAQDLDAGDLHSLSINSDGTMATWGDNADNKLGDGATTDRTAPFALASPTLIALIAGGDDHSVAVTTSGHVWTWGGNTYGQLGDGTTTGQVTPQDVLSIAGTWGAPPAPVLSLAPGTYNGPQTVFVTADAGVTVRYTTSGADPIESDPEVPGGGILIEATTTLKARAWRSGYLPSPVATGLFVLQPLAPVITPSTGYYMTPPTVTMSAPDAAATIRFTIDGSTPTESSPVYTAGFVAGTSMTVQARAFRTGWTASAITTSNITLTEGYLDAPVADSPSGVYQPTHVVSLSAAPEATIRYTTDGGEPSPTSAVYSTPFSFSAGTTTVNARAYREFWAPSPVLSVTYTIDDIAPTIVATVSPLANSSGWHGTPVTVTFECTDTNLASCPSPTTVSQEGVGLLVSGTATDEAGHSVSTSVTLNVDFTPPSLTLTSPTGSGTTSAATVGVSGVVADAGSGLAYVACNGVTGTVTGDAASCTVPLKPGLNGVVLVARDAAGNVASAGVDITRGVAPTMLRLSPSNRTLLIGESVSLSLTDDAGLAVAGATWTSSDPGAATISTDPYPVVTAMGAGTTTLTASKDGLTAEAVVTVAAGTALADGTMRWKLSPSGSFAADRTFHANRVAGSEPDLFVTEAIEENTFDQRYTILGVTSDGAVLWSAAAPGHPVFADTFGGVVTLVVRDEGTWYSIWGLARLGGPSSAPPWRFEPEGGLYGTTVQPAQAPDGTIYVIERGADSSNAELFLTALDGQTGQARARTPLPQGVFRYGCPEAGWRTQPYATQPVIGSDGRAYVQVRQWSRTVGSTACSGLEWSEYRLLLIGMGPDGATTTREVFQNDGDHTPLTGKTLPDGLGGLLITWDANEYGTPPTLTRFSETGARLDTALGDGDMLALIGTDPANEQATAYMTSNLSGVRALDVETLSTLWSNNTTFTLATLALAAGPDRGAIVDTSAGLMTLDGTGQPVATAPPLGLSSAVQFRFGLWTGHSPTGELEARVSTPFNEVPVSFAQKTGNASGQKAPRRVRFATREEASLAALEHLKEVTSVTRSEWSGQVCQRSGYFEWSRFYTILDPGTSGPPPTGLCNAFNTFAAFYHTHPLPNGMDHHSGGDTDRADSLAGIPSYLLAPKPNAGLSPTRMQILKTWNSGDRSATQNICLLGANRVWAPYQNVAGTENARCDTPTP
jgi:alpha-tubulin suppressor-like RCC1 family protein